MLGSNLKKRLEFLTINLTTFHTVYSVSWTICMYDMTDMHGGNKQFINRCEDSLLIPIFFHWSKHVTTHISYINDNKDLDGQERGWRLH